MKRFFSIVLVAILAVTSLAGCGGKTAGTEAPKEGNKVVKYNIGSDPKTLDPALNAEVQAGTVLENIYEGLMRLDENDKAVPGVAEKVDISEDGLTYTFHLRDAKWSDESPVTAQDFEYAWKRALDQKTAAEYAYQLYYLQNGEKYNSGEATAEEVGVKAIDEKTLEVKLVGPTPYFLELTAFPTYFPVKKDIVEKDPEAWATRPENCVFNGPFKATAWERNNVIKTVKNENYHDAQSVKLDGVDYTMITEETTSLSAFESGEIDGSDNVPAAQIPRLQAEKNPGFTIHPQLGTYYYSFNVTKEPMNNPKVRRALSLAIDRKAIVEVVTKGGEMPAGAFVPPGVKEADGKEFREKGKDYGIKETAQIEEAKKLLAEAGYPDGKGFPKVTVIYNTLERHKAIAEAIQEMWKKNLGVEVELQNQEWKVFQEARVQGDFVIARDGWLGDYSHPMTFLDLFISSSGNNHSHWKNPEFDQLITDAKVSTDVNKSFELMHQAEDLMMANDIIMPIYYYTNPELMREDVKDVRVSPLGFVFFDSAYVE